MLKVLVRFLVFLVIAAAAREISDEEYAQFPRLYHLDDFEGCLSKTDGLYCLGTFRIEKPKQYDPTYELIKEYSEDPFNFNRTQLHRGYCVSERCPSAERNSSLRFERCAALWGRKRKLRLSLKKLTYCRTHAQEYARRHNPEPLDLPQRILLVVAALLCIANFVGTCYDVLTGDNKKTNNLLAVWSIRSNWRRLTATYEDGDPRLNALVPVQGVRVFLMILVMGTHAACIHDMLYLHNPRYVEKVARTAPLMIFMNGTSVVMIFVLVSSFLLAYNLLLFSKTQELKMSMLKWCVIKRIARMSPISLLVVGYAATFWPHVTGGPMWPTLVEPEAKICREKFWSHALYVNNLWRAEDHCLVQTWFLATDMQLYILASLLTLWLARKRLMALPILGTLIFASCVLNGGLAYYFDWQSIMYHVYPETMHTMYHDVPSFYRLYTTPWGSLPACLMGLLLAHLHFELQERGVKVTSYRWFRWVYTLSPLSIVCWLVAGHWLRQLSGAEFTALYVAMERPVLSILSSVLLLGLFNGMTGFLKNYFSWSGWHAMGRMSLSVLMTHWLVNTCIAASRAQPVATSLLDVTVDTVGTGFWSYVLAIPLTLMIEMPMNRFINTLIFSSLKSKSAQSEKTTLPEKTTQPGKTHHEVPSPLVDTKFNEKNSHLENNLHQEKTMTSEKIIQLEKSTQVDKTTQQDNTTGLKENNQQEFIKHPENTNHQEKFTHSEKITYPENVIEQEKMLYPDETIPQYNTMPPERPFRRKRPCGNTLH